MYVYVYSTCLRRMASAAWFFARCAESVARADSGQTQSSWKGDEACIDE